jgi:hypothetical protein
LRGIIVLADAVQNRRAIRADPNADDQRRNQQNRPQDVHRCGRFHWRDKLCGARLCEDLPKELLQQPFTKKLVQRLQDIAGHLLRGAPSQPKLHQRKQIRQVTLQVALRKTIRKPDQAAVDECCEKAA